MHVVWISQRIENTMVRRETRTAKTQLRRHEEKTTRMSTQWK